MNVEEILIGQLLMWPRHATEVAVRPEDFVSVKCRKAYEAVQECVSEGIEPDFVTVARKTGLDAVWIAGLTTDVTPNVSYIVEQVLEESRRHRLSVLMREGLEQLGEHSSADVLAHLEAGLVDVGQSMDANAHLLSDRLLEMVELFERRKKQVELPGITTGLEALDELTMGLEPGKYYVVGARPSRGKSALLLNMALAARVPIGFISIESGEVEVLERAFAILGNVEANRLKSGMFGTRDMHGIGEATQLIQDSEFYIADKPNMHLSEVKAVARQMVRKYGARALYLDYVQLVQTPGSLSDYERVSKVSVALKQLSRELEVPVVVAAQLNRGSEESKERRPRLSDFKNSGQIEQDADVAILIHWSGDGEQVWLNVEKNRDGACADIRVYFDKAKVKFANFTGEYA